jgi:hypothetical protein
MVVAESVIVDLRKTIDAHMARGGDAVAVRALESLAALDDDRALRHVHAVSVRATGKLKKRAAIVLGDICRRRSFTQDQLEDAIITGLGLDESGSMTFDYGARRIAVGFDELLRPVVRDETGAVLAALPHATKADDAAKAANAAEAWKTIKDEVKLLASARTARLDRAMCDERFWWTVESVAKSFATRKLLLHIARRVVYGVVENHRVTATFRVAEDGTYAGPDDATLSIAPQSRVVVVHPALIEPSVREAWQRVFDDYEILQPFPQIRRDAPTLDEAELKTSTTRRFVGEPASGGRFFALHKAGWTASWDGLSKEIGTHAARLSIDPGISSFMSKPEDQTLGELTLVGCTFRELSPVTRWELLREVQLVTNRKGVL